MTTTSRSHAAQLERVEAPGSMLTPTAAKALAVLRISTGFVFLWAFLDKTFGWNYSTPTAKAWINGGSPTKGFLSSVDVGPFQGTFHDLAGTTFANWAFMLGLLGIGVALILGIGLRIAAGAATLMMAMTWLAGWPLAKGSSNPIVDYHDPWTSRRGVFGRRALVYSSIWMISWGSRRGEAGSTSSPSA